MAMPTNPQCIIKANTQLEKKRVPDPQESVISIYNRMPQVNGMDKQDGAAAVCLKCEKKLKASLPHCSSSN